MSARDGNRRRPLSDEERVLWKTITRSIAPLRARIQSDQTQSDDEPDVEPAPPPKKTPRSVKSAPPSPVKSVAPAPLEPLGRRMKQRVARGREAIEGRLDLHGLTQSEAHSALLQFLRSAVARNARLVLVITGKGARGEGERGVLKRQVPNWLALPEFRTLVVGFENAHITHGGEGALYVRLRRARGE